MKKLDGIMFDLDGTLWDSSKEVALSWNETIKRYEEVKRTLTQKDIRGIMGLQVPGIAQKLFPDLEEEKRVEIVTACCLEECGHLRKTGGDLFAGMRETIETLAEQYPLFIVSNCLEGYIEAFLEFHRMGRFFSDFLAAGTTGLEKADNIKRIRQKHHLEKVIYLGDTAGDQEACEKSGTPFVFASYGFGHVRPGGWQIGKISDLPDLIRQIEEIIE
ncbi:MAG: HAD family hydrolase [Lachnospiraceae bacterium]|nr:HAD family hydrolase [Candidatus Fimimorpha excrementavium]